MATGMGLTRKLQRWIAAGALVAMAFAFAVVPSAPASAQVIGGPILYQNVPLAADHYALRAVWLRGGEVAEIHALGTADVDLYLFDTNGNLVAKDEGMDHSPVVRFTPAQNGRYIIAVVNADEYDLRYDLSVV